MSTAEKIAAGFQIALQALIQGQQAGAWRIKEIPKIELGVTVGLMTFQAVKMLIDADGDGVPDSQQ